jgi:hypothetical protein
MNMLPVSYSEKSMQATNMHDASTGLTCPEALALIILEIYVILPDWSAKVPI